VSDDIRDVLHRMAAEAEPARTAPSPTMLRRATRRRARSATVFGLLVALVGYGAFAGVRAANRPAPAPVASSPEACSTWTVVPTPNVEPDRLDNSLSSVVAFNANDAWAVGYSRVPGEGGPSSPLVLHWDGSSWTSVEVPDPIDNEGQLLDITGTAPNDVWAIGLGHDVLHWDGSTWSAVPLADPGTEYWHLEALSAVSPDDVWAAGNTATGQSGETLIEHWDGARWRVVDRQSFTPEPQTGDPYAGLSGIDALDGAVWAVGQVENVAPAGESNTLALAETAAGWKRIATPDAPTPDGKPYSHLLSVSEAAPGDVWAVGIAASTYGVFGAGDRALVEHWKDDRWLVADTWPADSRLVSVVALAADEVWAVGSTGAPAGSFSPLVKRWNGATWEDVPVDVSGSAGLSHVAVSSSGDLWAVGGKEEGDHSRTFALHCVPG
jgi:hypothetical protein